MIDLIVAGRALENVGPQGRLEVTATWLRAVLDELTAARAHQGIPVLDLAKPQLK